MTRRRTRVLDATNCYQPRLTEPWHVRADRWLFRNWRWLLPLSVLLMLVMKWALYPEAR